jgi:hypothetical protein
VSSPPPSIEHERAFELLPWLVNDTLTAAERGAVEAHVRSCLPCRRELKDQQRLLAALQTQPTVHVSEQNAYDRLADTLDERERPARDSPLAAFLRFGVIATIGVAFVAVLLWLTPEQQRDGSYATLADTPAATARTPQIDVVFTRDTTASDIVRLLNAVDAEIVAGPSDVGRYGLRLRSGNDDVARTLERLMLDPHVRLAARAQAGAAP